MGVREETPETHSGSAIGGSGIPGVQKSAEKAARDVKVGAIRADPCGDE
jgi:hypothetical protein